jgi:hypothetical protein
MAIRRWSIAQLIQLIQRLERDTSHPVRPWANFPGRGARAHLGPTGRTVGQTCAKHHSKGVITMPASYPESEQRNRARALIRTRRFPTMTPTRIVECPGGGLRCTLCAGIIDGTETAYEFNSAEVGAPAVFRLHSTCYEAWRLECAHSAKLARANHPVPDLLCPVT